MSYPDNAKDYLPYSDLAHHDKAKYHHSRDGDHHPDLGTLGHALLVYIAFKVVLVEPGASEPMVKFL